MTYDVHPLAALFPMLGEDELAALADDVAANGLRSPVVLDVEGRVLDGRNRLAACERAGITPTFTTYEGDAAAFVLSANVQRRHMTTGARAMATALVLAAEGKRENGRWKRGSVSQDPDSSRSAWRVALGQAGVVLDYAREDLAPAVVSGALALENRAFEAEMAFWDDAERRLGPGGTLGELRGDE